MTRKKNKSKSSPRIVERELKEPQKREKKMKK